MVTASLNLAPWRQRLSKGGIKKKIIRKKKIVTVSEVSRFLTQEWLI